MNFYVMRTANHRITKANQKDMIRAELPYWTFLQVTARRMGRSLRSVANPVFRQRWHLPEPCGNHGSKVVRGRFPADLVTEVFEERVLDRAEKFKCDCGKIGVRLASDNNPVCLDCLELENRTGLEREQRILEEESQSGYTEFSIHCHV